MNHLVLKTVTIGIVLLLLVLALVLTTGPISPHEDSPIEIVPGTMSA